MASRREFALGESYGLDGYLSGGIRHGNLEALLRTPFQSANMLGSFDSTGAFVAPKLYRELAAGVSPQESSHVLKACERFATEFQKIVNNVLNTWIQIRLDDSPAEAVFDFSLDSTQIRLLEAELRNTQTVDECVARCVRYWWARTTACLAGARSRIRTRLRIELEAILDQFVVEFSRSALPLIQLVTTNMVGPIRAELEVTIEKVASWFEIGESREDGEIEAELAVAVARSTVQNLHPGFRFEWNTRVEPNGIKLPKRGMKHWVDILMTILHNVVQHSGQGHTVHTSIRLTFQDGNAIIVVRNPLAAEVDLAGVDRAIAAVNHQVSDDAYMDAVRREGRTGLLKVLKAARVDLRSYDASLAVERADGEFVVRLDLPRVLGAQGRLENAHPFG